MNYRSIEYRDHERSGTSRVCMKPRITVISLNLCLHLDQRFLIFFCVVNSFGSLVKSMDPSFYFIFYFLKDFLIWTIFKVLIEFATILLLFYVLVFWTQGMWDLSSPQGIEPKPPALEGKVLTIGLLGKSLNISFLSKCLSKYNNYK